MQEVEQHWEKRLRDGMTACERKFAEEATEWERRLRDTDTAWQTKVMELEQLWRKWLLMETPVACRSCIVAHMKL